MIRSPFFYVGDKYKLMPQLSKLFPKNISLYIEPFVGGGSSMLSVDANEYLLNDINENMVNLHNFLLSYCNNSNLFFERLFSTIDSYGLSISFKNDIIPLDLKKKYPKTYYAKYNKEKYKRLKNDFNNEKVKDNIKLYLLLIYGFNHMIRFNKSGSFNLPVGNVDFNKNVYDSLVEYFAINRDRKITFMNCDFEMFVRNISFKDNSFVYLDPPYYISQSEYNKLWKEEDEIRLYNLLDYLNEMGVKFGITNLLSHKGKINPYFQAFSKKYKFKILKSNYISYNDNSIKNDSLELYVYNY